MTSKTIGLFIDENYSKALKKILPQLKQMYFKLILFGV